MVGVGINWSCPFLEVAHTTIFKEMTCLFLLRQLFKNCRKMRAPRKKTASMSHVCQFWATASPDRETLGSLTTCPLTRGIYKY